MQPRHLPADDLQFLRGLRIIDPVIEAPALQRIVHFARPVGRDDDDRRLGGLDRRKLRDRHLEIREHFQQEGFEGLVGAVELVDQEDRRTDLPADRKRLQHRAADQVALGKDIRLDAGAILVNPEASGKPDLQHLRRIIPLVDGGGDIEAFVALQPDQRPVRAPSASALAISVFPTPASPSRNSGRFIFSGEKEDRGRATGLRDNPLLPSMRDRLVDRRRAAALDDPSGMSPPFQAEL